MNIFFIFPSIKVDKTINHGIASLCGIIKSKGHSVDLYHPDKVNIDDLYKHFRAKQYDLCLVSTVSNQWFYALELIRALKKISDIPVIVGGHHTTSNPNILEEHEEIDGICIGEGDIALTGLLENFPNTDAYHSIQNLCFRHNGEIIKNDIGMLVENLDDLPYPDYSVFGRETVLNYPALMFSRGCPYNCTYCCNNKLRNLYKGKGKYMRLKSVERAIAEVDSLVKYCGPPVLNFDDDTFVKNREWLFSFLDKYKEISGLPFNCNTRPETVTEDLCNKLKEANCSLVSVGIESGSINLRKKILKRHMSDEVIKNAFDLLKKAGIKTFSYNMVGIPDETYKDYLDTVRLNRLIAPDVMQISIFYPYVGTELGDYAKAKGLFADDNSFSHSYFAESILNMKQFPKWKIKYAQAFFHFNVFRSQSIFKAIYYLLRYNLSKNAFLKKTIRTVINIFRQQ